MESWFRVFLMAVMVGTIPSSFAANRSCEWSLDSQAEERTERLRHYQSILKEEDTIALRLTFKDQARFTSVLKGLRKEKANFLFEGFIKYDSRLQPFWVLLGRATKGFGQIYLRLEKRELSYFSAFLELADKIEPAKTVGADDNGVTRAYRTAEEKVHADDYENWSRAKKRESIRVFSMTSHSRDRFEDLVSRVKLDHKVSLVRQSFNKTQSIGYLVLEGDPSAIENLIERSVDIHAFQID